MTNFDVIGTFMAAFLNSINFGYSAIQPSVNYIMSFMIVLVIVTTALLTWVWGDWEAMIRGLVSKIILIGFVLLLVSHWASYTDDVGAGLTQLGLKAGGQGGTAQTFLQNPVSIAHTGFQLCQSLCAAADLIPGGLTGLNNLPDKLIYGLAAIGVFLSYAILALQVLVTFLEFKIVNLAALVFVPFAVFQRTSFLSDRSFGFMFSAGIKLFVLALIVSIGITFTVQFSVSATPNLENALAVLTGSVMLMMLAIAVPRLAQALISGGPQLGGGDGALGAGALAGTVGAAGYFGSRALGAAGHAGGGVVNRAIDNVNSSANGGRPGMNALRAAAAAGTGGSTAGNPSPFRNAATARAGAAFTQPSGGAGITSTKGSQPEQES